MVKTRNYILIGITAVLLCIVGGVVGATFSRYTSSATATPQAQVAKWKVLVGTQDISDGQPHSFTATINWDENENILNNGTDLIAPGSTGKITFAINATGTQVPIDYSVNINTEEIDKHTQIKIASVTATPSAGEVTSLNKSESNYNGSIELNAIGTPITITINVQWEAQTNDPDDTSLGAAALPINLPITVTANQRIKA